MILFYILLMLIVIVLLVVMLGLCMRDTETFKAIDERIACKIRENGHK